MRAIKSYKSASKYLDDHLNGYGKIPEKDWRTERERLLSERSALVAEYYDLNEDVKNVEALRRGAENLMQDITPERTTARAQGLDL
ncbi:MAG: hypothetical protein FWG31_07900 [Oscillospiraceae bacterium]|nr:hypothetical protein [Oscillospiraceae bacterium]